MNKVTNRTRRMVAIGALALSAAGFAGCAEEAEAPVRGAGERAEQELRQGAEREAERQVEGEVQRRTGD